MVILWRVAVTTTEPAINLSRFTLTHVPVLTLLPNSLALGLASLLGPRIVQVPGSARLFDSTAVSPIREGFYRGRCDFHDLSHRATWLRFSAHLPRQSAGVRSTDRRITSNQALRPLHMLADPVVLSPWVALSSGTCNISSDWHQTFRSDYGTSPFSTH